LEWVGGWKGDGHCDRWRVFVYWDAGDEFGGAVGDFDGEGPLVIIFLGLDPG
jgi:hypothetical protein